MSNKAWVTLATNDSYGLGALVLAHSLRRTGSSYPAVVMITPAVTEAMRERLRSVFAGVVVVDVLDSLDAAHLALLQRPELGITFTKIHCWSLTQYEKCVFLDADTLVVQNCDELFEREELSAAPDVGWPDCFNSGVFVYKPSQETFNALIQYAQDHGSFDGGDQGLLNSFFSNWAHGDIAKHLPFLYNVTSAAFYSYLPALKQFGGNLKIVHFIGAAKPWLQRFNWDARTVEAPDHLRGLLQLWWDLFVSSVHQQLDTTMVEVEPTMALPPPDLMHYYEPFVDPLSEFPWHRPEVQTWMEELDTDHIDLSDVHDPWENYRGSIVLKDRDKDLDTNDTFNTNIEHSESKNIYQSTYAEHLHNANSIHTNYDDVLNQNQNKHYSNDGHAYSHFHNKQNEINKDHLYDNRSNDFREQTYEPTNLHKDPYVGNNLSVQTQIKNYSNERVSTNPAPNSLGTRHLNGWASVNDIPKRHPYDGYYLRHTSTVNALGYKICTHQVLLTPKVSSRLGPSQIVSSDLQSGVAGNLARVTPGSIGSQREALDELSRRQGWEAGNIDYMGADSFDNIWAKISQTLSQTRTSPPKQSSPPPKEPTPPSEDVKPKLEETPEVILPTEPLLKESAEPCAQKLELTQTSSPSTELTLTAEELIQESSAPTAESTQPPIIEPSALAEPPLTELVPSAEETVQVSSAPTAEITELPIIEPSSLAEVKQTTPPPSELISQESTQPPVIESSALEKTSSPPTELVPSAEETIQVSLAPTTESTQPSVDEPSPIVDESSEILSTASEPPQEPQQESIPSLEESVQAASALPEQNIESEPVKVETDLPSEANEAISASVEQAPVAVTSIVDEPTETSKSEQVSVETALPEEAPVAEPKQDVSVVQVSETDINKPSQEEIIQLVPDVVSAPVATAPEVTSATSPAVQDDAITPVKSAEVASSTTSSDSPPLANTPSKEETVPPSAVKSEGDVKGRKPAEKLQLGLPAAVDPLLTPDSELEDAAALAQSIIASELATPTVTSPTPVTPQTPSSPPTPTGKRLSADDSVPETPPAGPVSLAQIGVKATKEKPSTAAQIASSIEPTKEAVKTEEQTSAQSSTPGKEEAAPKKKIVKKVVKKDTASASGGDSSPVPPPRKKEKKPK